MGESRCHRRFHAEVAQSLRTRDRTHGRAHSLRRTQPLFLVLQLRQHARSDRRPQQAARWASLHIRFRDDLSRSRPDPPQRLQFRDRRLGGAHGPAGAQQHRGTDGVGHDLRRPRANRARRLGGGVRDSLQEPLLRSDADHLGLRRRAPHLPQERARPLVGIQSRARLHRRQPDRRPGRDRERQSGHRPGCAGLWRAAHEA